MIYMLLLMLLVGILFGAGGTLWFLRWESAYDEQRLQDKRKIEELEALVVRLSPTSNWERQFTQEERH